jgi:hypothetical protein
VQNLIVDLQYFAPVTLYKKLTEISNVIFEQYEHFDKMSFRNRAVVTGANGPINLSIPLQQGRNQRSLVKDVRIEAREDWQGRHWKTIQSCYNRSPFFEFYIEELEELYGKKYDYLWDWNLACFEWVIKQLRLSIEVNFSIAYQPLYDETSYVDWRGKILPKNKLTPGQYPVYRQVFEERLGFLPNLSILDLMFCQGNHAMEILRKAA